VSDVIVRNVAGDINFNDMSNYKTTINAAGTEATFTGSGDKKINQLNLNGLAQMDHSKDMVLSQKIFVEAMPNNVRGSAMASFVGSSYYFWMIDGASVATNNGSNTTKTYTLANLYNSSEKGLVLEVLTASGVQEIVLGKQVGDTFKLDYLWCKDGAVKVYVDGALKGSVLNATKAQALNDNYGYDGISMRKFDENTTVKVTDVSVEQVNVVQAGVREDLTAYTKVYCSANGNGEVRMNSNVCYIEKGGLSQIDHTKGVMFLMDLYVARMPLDNYKTSTGSFNFDAKNFDFYIYDGSVGQPRAQTFATMCNRTGVGLVLQVEKANGEYVDVVLDRKTGDTFQLGYKWLNDSVEVYVDSVLKATVDGVSYQKVSSSNANENDSIRIIGLGTGTDVTVKSLIVSQGDLFAFKTEGVDLTAAVTEGNPIITGGAEISFNVGVGVAQSVSKTGVTLIDHSKDMIFSQNIHVEDMAAGSPMVANGTYQTTGTGYFFQLATTNATVFANIYNDAAKGLVLQLQQANGNFVNIVLGKDAGDTFQLQLVWNSDDSAKVYVDGKLKGAAGNVSISDSSNQSIVLSCAAAGVKVNVSDLTLEYTQVKQDLSEGNYTHAYTGKKNGTITLSRYPSLFFKSGMAEIDRSKDIWFSQILNIVSMPADAPVEDGVRNPSNYGFWLIDGEQGAQKTMLFCNMYNSSAKGLVLQVMQADGTNVEVVMDKEAGNSFELGVLWGADGTATVYVDGTQKGKVTDVDYMGLGAYDGNGYDGLRCIMNYAGTVVHVNGMVIAETEMIKGQEADLVLEAARVAGDVTVSGTTANFNVVSMQSVAQNGLEIINHSKDLLLKQTIKVTAMSAGKFMADGTEFNPAGTGYTFWLVDGEETADKVLTFANLYNDAAKGLVLQVQRKNGTFANIALDKKLGDTFQLMYLWGSNNLVKVYVDGVQKGSAADVTIAAQGTGFGYDGYQMRTTGSGNQITVSDVSISNTGVCQDMNSFDLVYVSANNGEATLSRNPSYVGKTNIAQLDHTKDVMLTQTLNIAQMGLDNPKAETEPDRLTGTNYFFYLMDGGLGMEKTFMLVNIYNSSTQGLVAQVQQVDMKMVEVPLGKTVGETFELGTLWGADGTATIYVDGVKLATVENVDHVRSSSDELADSVRFVCGGNETVIRLSGVVIAPPNVFVPVTPGVDVSGGQKDGNISVTGGTVKFDMKADYQIIKVDGLTEVNHGRDLTLSQTLTINALPTNPMVPGKGYQDVGTGYYFWVIDGDVEEYKYMVFGNIYNDATWGLVLQVENSLGGLENIKLGKKVGDTFTLDFTWTTDNVVKVYVDGAIKGQVLRAARAYGYGTGTGYDGYQLRSRAFGTDVVISNVYLTPGVRYTNIKDEVTGETVLAPVVDLKNVTETNLKLPATFKSPYLGDVPLTWTSSDPTVWNLETGVINHTQEKVGKHTILTASVPDQRTKQIFRVEACAVGLGVIELKSPKILNANFATNVVLDGKFTNTTDGATTHEGWHISTLIGDTGRFGVQWDTKNLYLAVLDLNPEAENALAITVKGKAVDLTKAVRDGAVLEIAIPMSDLGIATNNYGAELAATVTLGEGSWSGNIRLTSTDWFVSSTVTPGVPLPPSVGIGASAVDDDQPTEFQDAHTIDFGYHFFDRYNVNGFNPHSIRNYALLMGLTSNQKQWEFDIMKPMADRDIANYHEFDFIAYSMPEYLLGTDVRTNPGYATCGFTWNVVGEYYMENDSLAPNLALGIVNTADGLVFVARGNKGDSYIPLNKRLGDFFRVGVRWEITGDITVFIDNEKVGYVEDMVVDRHGYGENGISLSTIRSTDVAINSNDNIDVTVTNLAIGTNYGDTLLDTLIWEVIRGKNVRNMEAVTRDVILLDTWQTPQLPTPQKVTWTSSNEAVLNSKTGDVTRPEGNGELVYLTAHCGGEEKTFELYVKGRNPDGVSMGVLNDRGTANGVGKPENETYWFTLDIHNNSVIYDQGETKKVNYIELTDIDDLNRLNESVLTIWYSDTNKTVEDENGETIPAYTRIDGDFKILRAGNKTYLYGFEIEARYVKVHYTDYFDKNDISFNAVLRDMIRVGCTDIFGDGDTEFATESFISVSNELDKTLYNESFSFTPAEAGVNCLKADMSDVRFFLNGEYLYHYFDGEKFVVRISEIPANGEVALKVLSGNANAMDISNKEYVYEVVEGTREFYVSESGGRWFLTMPDGELWSFKGTGADSTEVRISKDQGMTWTEATPVNGSNGVIADPTGAIYDDEANRIIVSGWAYNAYGNCMTSFLYSDDYGKSWQRSTVLEEGNASVYNLSYSSPIRVSSYDGEGPNVDFVLNTAEMPNIWDKKEGAAPGIMITRVFYTCDGGVTWTLGPDEIQYSQGKELLKTENGMNEATILEDDNGRLVLLARCQFGEVVEFGAAYSYDFGKTWETETGRAEAELSGVYAPNTQPIMFEYKSAKYLSWGGNNVLGGGSYMRFPMNIGVSYDNLETFENIQDIFSRTSCQGITMSTRCYCTNQVVEEQGDALVMAWNDDYGTVRVRIDNFNDYFYKTNGAYDSFENGSAKAEGWEVGAGSVETSDKYVTDGKYSMKINSLTSVLRSVPYVQDGKMTFDLYIENLANTVTELELESAYGDEHGKAAPVALTIRGGKLYALNEDHSAEVEIPVQLKQGWNSFQFDLALAQETSEVTLTVNGTATELPVARQIGDYICFVHITNTGRETLYLDNFFLDDNDELHVPEEEIKTETIELTEVPEELKEIYTNVDGMTAAMSGAILNQEGNIFTAENMAFYGLSVQLTRDAGKTWSPIKVDRMPREGITVVFPYPEGTSAETHTFTASQMGMINSVKLGTTLGEAAILDVVNGEDGVYVTVKNWGPVALAWSETGSAPIIPDNGGEVAEPDNTWIIIVIAVVVALALAGVVVVIILKKKSAAAAPAEADETPQE